MTQEQLTLLNIGQNLDDLMNLDPRGYGVCRILYKASRAYAGEPVSMHAARVMQDTIKPGDLVYVFTGFVLLPHRKAEMDGICGAMHLVRAIALMGGTPVMIVPQANVHAIQALAPVVGLHYYDNVADAAAVHASVAVLPFTTDASKASACADAILAQGKPSLVLSTETAGANALGVYHNALGRDITELEAKSDLLFKRLGELGVPTIAVGDLGNEMGMGTLREHLVRWIPSAAPGSCQCGCGGGLVADTNADYVVTATVSDWGVYAMLAALAHLTGKYDLMATAERVREVITTASRSGMVDLYGWLIPAADGCDADFNATIAHLMRRCVENAAGLTETCRGWFEKVDALGFFEE